jgi:predicted secreted protein
METITVQRKFMSIETSATRIVSKKSIVYRGVGSDYSRCTCTAQSTMAIEGRTQEGASVQQCGRYEKLEENLLE